MLCKIVLCLIVANIVTFSLVNGHINFPIRNEALDKNLFKEVLDPELCSKQIRQIRNNPRLTMYFADAGLRVPRGILEGNTIDMGNYHQCIGFNEQVEDTELLGKYCIIRVPMDQSFHWPARPNFKTTNFDPNLLFSLDNKTISDLEDFNAMKTRMLALTGDFDNDRSLSQNSLSGLTFRLAICVPKPCTTEQAINSFLFNISSVGFKYTDDFCRLPDDKPWVPGDTVAIVVFSLIGLITVVSSSYDVWQTIILKKDPKTVSVLGRSFSVYTNGRRLMSFDSAPNTIHCLDGIRALAMIWVVLGHSFSSVQIWANPLSAFVWSTSWQSLWIVAATLTVDTFFTLSGFLVVYTTVGKLSSKQLLQNIHLFWLNRLLRMFPLLATIILLEATYLNRIADGPIWTNVESHVERCRTTWWSTLLHIQNFMNPIQTCIAQTWYLAIDVQLHILSPIILVWVLMGNKRIAWAALLCGLLGILAASTTYIFIKGFHSSILAQVPPDDSQNFFANYYMNTLTRAPAFFVGMIFGYIVKTQKLEMSKFTTICFWVAAFSLSTFLIYVHNPTAQPDWDNQLADSLFNSFVRPLWGAFIGCLIFACVNGYAGPINWFLSLNVWKLQSRLSYGIYLFHYALMAAVYASDMAPRFFSVKSVAFTFLAHYSLSFLVTFLMVLVIDAPCSTLFKLLLGGGAKKTTKDKIDEEQKKENDKTV